MALDFGDLSVIDTELRTLVQLYLQDDFFGSYHSEWNIPEDHSVLISEDRRKFNNKLLQNMFNVIQQLSIANSNLRKRLQGDRNIEMPIATLRELKSSIVRVTSDISKSRQQIDDGFSKMSEDNEKLRKVQQEILANSADLARIQNDFAEVQRELSAKSDELAKIEKDIAAKTDDLGQASKEILSQVKPNPVLTMVIGASALFSGLATIFSGLGTIPDNSWAVVCDCACRYCPYLQFCECSCSNKKVKGGILL